MPKLDQEVDRLYGLPRDQFVPARNELAKKLKSEGNADAAATVKGLAKPTAAAALLNRLPRDAPELVRKLLTAGAGLQKAQLRALSGGHSEELRRASTAEREAVRELVAEARTLGGNPSQAVLDRVRESLSAAALDDKARELLEQGRFIKEVEAAGFPLLPAPAGARRPRRRASTKQGRDEQLERVAALRSQVRDLRGQAGRAAVAAKRAQADAERAAEAAQKAAREEAELQEELHQAERELSRASKTGSKARRSG
jgi:hypothetical protein